MASMLKKTDVQEAILNLDTPFVSVIVPAYNSARTLEECLKSIKGLHRQYQGHYGSILPGRDRYAHVAAQFSVYII